MKMLCIPLKINMFVRLLTLLAFIIFLSQKLNLFLVPD